MAIEASLTGHLVLSTHYTNSAVETVSRLLEMGIDPFNFADSVARRLGAVWRAPCAKNAGSPTTRQGRIRRRSLTALAKKHSPD